MARPAQDEHPADRTCSLDQLRRAYRFAVLELSHEIHEIELHVAAIKERRGRIQKLLAALDAAQPPENVK